MIILTCGDFDIYDKYGKTGKTEFVASHGYDTETGKTVIVSNDHPRVLGAVFDTKIGEWVIL